MRKLRIHSCASRSFCAPTSTVRSLVTSEKQNASGGSDSTPRLLIWRAKAVEPCPSFSSRTSSSETWRGLLFFVLRGLDHCSTGPSLCDAGRTLNQRSFGTEPFVYGIFHK